jgi:hypothetical protein
MEAKRRFPSCRGPETTPQWALGAAGIFFVPNDEAFSKDAAVRFFDFSSRRIVRVATAGRLVQILVSSDELTFAMGRRGVYVASSYGVGANYFAVSRFRNGCGNFRRHTSSSGHRGSRCISG